MHYVARLSERIKALFPPLSRLPCGIGARTTGRGAADAALVLLCPIRGWLQQSSSRRDQGQTTVSQLDRQFGGARAHERGEERAGARVECFELSGGRIMSLSRREQGQALGLLLFGKRRSTRRSAPGVRERAVTDPYV